MSRRWLFTRAESATIQGRFLLKTTDEMMANIVTKLIPQGSYDFPGETRPTSGDRVTNRMKCYSPFRFSKNDFINYTHFLCFDDDTAKYLEQMQALAVARGHPPGQIVQLFCPYNDNSAAEEPSPSNLSIELSHELRAQRLISSVKDAIKEFCSLHMGPWSIDELKCLKSQGADRTIQCVLPPNVRLRRGNGRRIRGVG